MVQTKNSLEGEILDKSPSTCKEGHSQVFAWVQTTDPPIAWDGTLGKCFLAPTVACGPCSSEIPALLITGGIPLSPPYTDLQLLRVIYSVFLHRCNYRNFFLRRFSSLSFLTLLFLFFFFSLFRLPKSFWSLSLSLICDKMSFKINNFHFAVSKKTHFSVVHYILLYKKLRNVL